MYLSQIYLPSKFIVLLIVFFSQPVSRFLGEFNSFLSVTASAIRLHGFVITSELTYISTTLLLSYLRFLELVC